MNRQEAMDLLSACRPDGSDAGNPRLAEAMALVERDPELREWFEAEQASDRITAAKLMAAPLPPDLLERIRAGTRVRIAGKPRRPSFALAMAASLALLGLISALWFNRAPSAAPGSFAACRTDMAQFLQEFPKLDITTDRLPEVREWLTRQHSLGQADLPAALKQFPSIGCRTIEWQDKKLALVCFMVEGEVVHLFVMPRSAFPDATPSATPAFARAGSQNTASWSNDENLYLAITQANEALLRKLL